MDVYRQGDITLVPVEGGTCQGCGNKVGEIVSAMKSRRTPETVLALGEATGHKHKMMGDLEVWSVNVLPTVVRVVDAPATLTHEDHGEPRDAATNQPVKVAEGTYHVHHQQVQDYQASTPRPSVFAD